MTGALAHGGGLEEARRLFPGAPWPFLDLSTGINPLPYPVRPGAEAARRLPEAGRLEALRGLAARAYGVGAEAAAEAAGCVAAAPGTQLLIGLLPLVLAPLVPAGGVVRVLEPTYGEHARSWRLAGRAVEAASDLDALAGADVAVLCHPNNPDGRRFEPGALLSLAGRLARRGGVLVVDEAFADLEPPGGAVGCDPGAAGRDGRASRPDGPGGWGWCAGAGLGWALPRPGLVLLRSFGKTFGLAGLRLGFALAEPRLAGRLREVLGPWAVSGPALEAGLQALADPPWAQAARARLSADSVRLDRLLDAAGFTVLGGTRLFRLALAPGGEAGAWHARLGRQGVLSRRFDGHGGWLRFGLPGSEADWDRLGRALAG